MPNKKGRGIGKGTKLAVAQFMAYVLEKRIIKIRTQSALHRMIEIAKFPHTVNWKLELVRPWPNSKRVYKKLVGRPSNEPLHWQCPVYSASQYIRVTEYITDKFFDVHYEKGRYSYTLNRDKCKANLRELTATLAA